MMKHVREEERGVVLMLSPARNQIKFPESMERPFSSVSLFFFIIGVSKRVGGSILQHTVVFFLKTWLY